LPLQLGRRVGRGDDTPARLFGEFSRPAGAPAKTQNPPGITNEGFEGNTDPDPDHAVQAQPVVAINSNSTTSDSAALKPPGC
jgi:hypothetical protein